MTGRIRGVLLTAAVLLGVLATVLAVSMAFTVAPRASSTPQAEDAVPPELGGPLHARPSQSGITRPTATPGGATAAEEGMVNEDSVVEEPVEEEPAGEESDAEESDAQESDAQESDAQESDAQESDAQESDAQESDDTEGSPSSSASGSTSSSRPRPTASPVGPGSVTVSGRAPLAPAGTWLSGAAGDGVANGEYAEWRGSEVSIAGTWADSNEGQVELWQLHPGGEYGSWDRPIDIAIGAIDEGETWEEAAGGAYDERWRQSLTNLRDVWGERSGTVYIRLAHEMNGDWYPWSVNAGNYQDFIQAWRGFRALQQEIFPESQLVFCVNRESVGNGIDWRETFPGAEYVDVMGVDYYNGWPYVDDQAGWDSSLTATDDDGAPKGLQAHLDFARSVGLPLAVPEWSGKAHEGDSPAFIEGMHDFFAANAGGGPGQLLYEVQFNVDMHDNSYRLHAGTLMPESAEAYRALF